MSNMGKMEELIKKYTQSEIGKKLYDLLISIENDKEFAALELSCLKTDENKQKLIDYIEKYDVDDPSDVSDLTDCILDGVEPEFEED